MKHESVLQRLLKLIKGYRHNKRKLSKIMDSYQGEELNNRLTAFLDEIVEQENIALDEKYGREHPELEELDDFDMDKFEQECAAMEGMDA
jgi:hypothetical protein